MIPWDYTKHTYENYLKLQPGIYPYKVYFYEGEPVELNGKTYDLSCKNAFPNSIADDKEKFCEMVQYAMDLFNHLRIGIEFEYQGYDIVTTYRTEFTVNNGNAIVYYNGFPWGGLGGFFPNKKEFGVAMHMGKEKEYNRYLGELVHEMLHCLGLGHKMGKIFTGKQVSAWLIEKDLVALEGELPKISPDSTHGLDVIYATDTKFKVSGYIRNPEKFEHAEAFIVGWSDLSYKRKLLYQTTIDANGYYEFRLRYKDGVKDGFKILCVGKRIGEDSYYWNDLNRQFVSRFAFRNRHVRYQNVNLNLFTEDSGIILSTL